MPFLESNKASIFYETRGEKGPWITLINGHTRSSRDFNLLAKSLVQAGFQCLTFDNRGAGQTQTSAEFTYTDMVQDVYNLWDAFGIKSSFVVGISMGGMLAQLIAAERNVSGLILISTASSEEELSPVSFGSWGRSPEEVQARLKHYFTPDFLNRNKLLVDAMAKQILHSVINDSFEERAQTQRRALQGIDTSPKLGHIRAPTLILHGEADSIISADAAHSLARQIEKAELKILAGKGHLLLAEDSKELAENIIDFCLNHRT